MSLRIPTGRGGGRAFQQREYLQLKHRIERMERMLRKECIVLLENRPHEGRVEKEAGKAGETGLLQAAVPGSAPWCIQIQW